MPTISRDQYHALMGLRVLADQHNRALGHIKAAVMEITGEEDEWGHSSDFTFGNPDYTAKDLLDKLRIEVVVESEENDG